MEDKIIKPGFKTTEFWTSISAGLVGVLTLTGIFTNDQAKDIVIAINSIVGGLMVICPAVAYAFSRGKAKGKK